MQFQEIILSPRAIWHSKWGGDLKIKVCMHVGKYEAKQEFSEGGGGTKPKHFLGGMDISWNNTPCGLLTFSYYTVHLVLQRIARQCSANTTCNIRLTSLNKLFTVQSWK